MNCSFDATLITDEPGIDDSDARSIEKKMAPTNPAAHSIEIRTNLFHSLLDTRIAVVRSISIFGLSVITLDC